ncbi:MAG: DUF2851 family protein [Chitinophagaceae bacterium]|nr:MAG: DUF2851 family protein [Chitinophagaceae bacterium]
MTEKLLQFIWQQQYFNKDNLCTEGFASQALQVLTAGTLNMNQGPDFLEGRIRIGAQVWAGNIELHVKASDWDKHGHENDANYHSVVLHVVWINDLPESVYYPPMLSLESRVSRWLLQQYQEWMMSPSFIPCGSRITDVKELVWSKWKERLVAERLESKMTGVYTHLKEANNHWEEVLWWMLAVNFGITVNKEVFGMMAKTLPITLVERHKSQIHQLEALLFGQAGLLTPKFTEAYPLMLKKEYQFLKKKFALKQVFAPVHFLRMRPVNFPTVRLAQLAALINQSDRLFSRLLIAGQVAELRKLFDVTANDYWHYHYRFEETTPYMPKRIGAQMIDNIIINTVIPLVFAYGRYHRDEMITDKVFHWLDILAAEKNRVTSRFYACGIRSVNAFDTQALHQLKTRYCDEKKCLACAVGNALLKRME